MTSIGSRAASPGRRLSCNNVLTRLNCSMNHQDLIITCIYEQFQGFLFSDLSGPLNSLTLSPRIKKSTGLGSMAESRISALGL